MKRPGGLGRNACGTTSCTDAVSRGSVVRSSPVAGGPSEMSAVNARGSTLVTRVRIPGRRSVECRRLLRYFVTARCSSEIGVHVPPRRRGRGTRVMTQWIDIDGSQGEGGGQILRTSLALSLATGRPFRIDGIRAGREKPGLLRQHLTAVHAAASVSGATVAGAELGSTTLSFEPGPVAGGEYHLAVGTAGSATLVLQTVLPALLRAVEPSELVLEGGTHNPFAPPFDFVAKTFVPVLRRMGADVTMSLERYGFYPAGGGRFSARVAPSALRPLSLTRRGERGSRARAWSPRCPSTSPGAS